MCIAIYKPAGVTLSKELLKTCFENNDDGCGFAYINESHTGIRKIFIKKTLDFEIFWRQYLRATKVNHDSPFLIHFRIKTHGPVDRDNCHPFMVDDEVAFIHNGIISGVGSDKKKSDTRLFNEKVLQKLPVGWENNEAIKVLVEDFILRSKLVTLDIDGNVQIFNEDLGGWSEGCWFSNDSWKPRKPYVSPSRGTNKSTFLLYTSADMFACRGCGGYHKLRDMRHFETYVGYHESFCKDCVDQAINTADVLVDDEVKTWKYVSELNSIKRLT